MTSEALWWLSRATGVTTMLLFTTVLVLGLLTAGRRPPAGDAQTVVVALHRWLSLGSLAFLLVHILSAVVDGYVPIGWYAVLVPFTSAYHPVSVALGTLAVDLLAAVVVTSLLRHRMSERAWKGVHLLAYAMWPLAVAHGILMASSDGVLLRGVTIGCGVVGVLAIGWRVGAQHADAERRAAVLASGEWS